MNPTLVVKQGDRYATFWRVPGFNLTGCTVRLIARRGSQPAVVLTSEITDPPAGEVRHILDGTLDVGLYAVELEISRDLEIITAPTGSYNNLRVIADLD